MELPREQSKIVNFPKAAKTKPIPKSTSKSKKIYPPPKPACKYQVMPGFNPYVCPLCDKFYECWGTYLKTYIGIPSVVYKTFNGTSVEVGGKLENVTSVTWHTLLELTLRTNTTPGTVNFAQSYISVDQVATGINCHRNWARMQLKILEAMGVIKRTLKDRRRNKDGTFSEVWFTTITYLDALKKELVANKHKALKGYSEKYQRRRKGGKRTKNIDKKAPLKVGGRAHSSVHGEIK
jgi:hypothetical protein